jgi:Domain of unknown function (DUF4252)
MKNLLRSSLAAATLLLALTATSFAADTDAGYFDMGQFTPAKDGKHVQINIPTGLLKFAAKIAAVKEPEAAAVIGNLQQVRVNVVSLDDKNRQSTTEQIASIRKKLTSQGWLQIVSVREQEGGDNVDVHVKQNSDDSIGGIVVTVLDGNGEAVFVNVVGNITAEQLGQVAEKFDIDPLRKVHAKVGHRHKGE